MLELNQNSITTKSSRSSKKLPPYIGIITTLIILFISLFLIGKSLNSVNNNYQEYQKNLIKMQQLDSDFNQEILKSRYELFSSYDSLVHNLNYQQSLQEKLITPPGFINDKEKQDLESIINQINIVLEQKETLSDRFKSKNALLKNSLRYLPLLTNQLETKFDKQDKLENLSATQLATLRSNLNRLMRSLLLYNISVDENIRSEIESLTTRLSQLEIEYGLSEEEFPSRLVESHTNIIINTKPEVEQLTAQLITPLRKEVLTLENLLDNSYKRASTTTNIYRLITLAWFLFLFALFNYILLKNLGDASPQFLQYKQKVKRISTALRQILVAKNDPSAVDNIPDITDLTSCRDDLGILATGVTQIREQIKQEQDNNLQEESFTFLVARLSLLIKTSQKNLNSSISTYLKSIFEDVLQDMDCQLIDITVEAEQIHLLFSYPAKIQLTQLVKEIKTGASSYLNQEFPTIGENIAKTGGLWSDAYVITSCDGALLNKKRSSKVQTI